MPKLRGGSISILVGLAAFASLGTLAQSGPQKSAPVPMATYTDPDGDVSFEYPAVWKIDRSPQFYIRPLILMGGRKPRVQVVFSTAGNLYEKTTLHGLVFAYVKTPQPTPETCAAMAVSPTPDKVETLTVNGVSFNASKPKRRGCATRRSRKFIEPIRMGTVTSLREIWTLRALARWMGSAT